MKGDGWLTVATEGTTDAEIVRVLLASLGLPAPGQVFTVSKPDIIGRTVGYNEAARHAPWYVQIDLDTDHSCTPLAAAQWLPEPSDWMCLSVVRPEPEAWMLADRTRCATWLGVSAVNIPREPEGLADAKEELIAITRRHGRRLRQQQLVPREGSGRQVGAEYEAELIRFVGQHWQPNEARRRSPSLDRAMTRLDQLWTRWRDHSDA